MGRIGPFGIWELVIILVLVLLIFGPRRLPEMARGIGQSVREFRRGVREFKSDLDGEPDDAGTRRREAAGSGPARAASPEAERDAPVESGSG